MRSLVTLISFTLITSIAFSQNGSEIFTSSGTFTVPDGVNLITIEVVGAGGDGGYNGSGGGGGGGYAIGEYSVTPSDVLTVTVGVNGQGAEAGTTSVDDFISATGGENGYSVSNPEIGGGGAGGVGIGGTIANYTGGNGGGGYYTYFGGGGGGAAGANGDGGVGGNTIVWNGNNCNTPGGDGGIGGGAPGGDGGKGAGFTDNFCNVTNPSAAGSAYGGGGGGANGNGGGPAIGAGGYCIIYYCTLDLTTTTSSDTISANATDATYQWIDCGNGNAVIPEQTFQDFIPTESGSYAVIITNNICSDTSACIDFIATSVSNNFSNKGELIAYPNPFISTIKILSATGSEDFELTNSIGQKIWIGKHIEQRDFSSLPAGWYLLKIQNKNSLQVLRLAK